jgi:hypothetical protein
MAVPALELILLCLAAETNAANVEAPRARIAVLEMKLSGADQDLGRMLSEIVATETARLTGALVVSPADIATMIGFEEKKQLLGCDQDGSCFAELGGALGVDLLVASDLGVISGTHVINIKLVDIKRAEVLTRVYRVVEGDAKGLLDFVREAMTEVLRPLIPAPKVPAVAPSVATVATTAAAAPDFLSSPWFKWGAVGLGAATLVTAGGLELRAKSEHDAALRAIKVGRSPLYPWQAPSHAERSATLSRAALGLAITGATITTAAAAWILVPEQITALFSAAPALTGDGLGVQVHGGF